MITYCTHRGFNKRMTWNIKTVRVCYSEHSSLPIQNTGLQHKKKLRSGLKKKHLNVLTKMKEQNEKTSPAESARKWQYIEVVQSSGL